MINAVISRIGRIPIDIYVMLMLFALVLGSDVAFGDKAPFMKDILYMYLFLFLITRTTLQRKSKAYFPLSQAIFNFAAMFIGTAILMLLLPSQVTALLIQGSFEGSVIFAASFGVLYAFIKAYIEEDIFRNRLVTVVGAKGQAVLFGLFHFFVLFAVFGFSYMLVLPVLMLMGLGYIWSRVHDRFGTIGSTGSHFAYNAAIMGILPRLLGSIV